MARNRNQIEETFLILGDSISQPIYQIDSDDLLVLHKVEAAVDSADEMPLVPATEIDIPQTRRLRLEKKDVKEHGFTPGCPGCHAFQHKKTYTQNHTEACQKRLEEAI